MKINISDKQLSFLKSVKRKMIFNKIIIIDFFRIKWLITLYFNFKMFKLKTALRLPIFFYERVLFDSLKGQIIINAPVTRGMVKVGNNLEIVRRAIGTSEFRIDGTFIINGSFNTGVDCTIIIQRGGVLEIGENSYLGSRTKIITTNRIILGRHFRFGFESQILDSTFHFMIDYKRNEVRRFNGEVFIDDYCWIGNRTSIMKNTITPKYTTVASNSLLNKDYTKDVPEKSIIGGIPAKLIRDEISRIYDAEKETIILNFFYSYPEEQVYTVRPDFL